METFFLVIFISLLLIFVILCIRIKNALGNIPDKDGQKNYVIYISIAICTALIIFSIVAPHLYTSENIIHSLNTSQETGYIGDTIGIMNPFIGIAAAILTFTAFYTQYKANQQQTAQFKDQAKDVAVERFENKFYNLIEIHRNNVTEVRIGESLYGRKAFINMFNELKFIYFNVLDFHNNLYTKGIPGRKSDEILFNISYLIFFFGIGENSSKAVRDLIGENDKVFFDKLEIHLNAKKNNWRLLRKRGKEISVKLDDIEITLNVLYDVCNGHMSRLSHYIRNLFQIVKFIDEQDDEIIDYEKKYQYVSTLRSQLSNHEQLLLYYNAISVLGQPWMSENLIEKYCIIRSLPVPLANFYKTPSSIFPKINKHGKVLFEWTQIRHRMETLN